LTILLLPVLLFALLQFGIVQTFVAQKAASYLSKELNTTITIGRLNVNLFLDVNIDDIEIYDLKDSLLFKTDRIQANIARFNIKNRLLLMNKLNIDQCYFAIRKYEDDSANNIKFITEYFKSTDTTKIKKKWKISCSAIRMNNSRFILDDRIKHKTKARDIGIDFTNLDIDSINVKIADFLLFKDTILANVRNISLVDRSGFELKRLSSHINLSETGLHAINTRMESNNSNITIDLNFEHTSYHAYTDFLNEIYISSVIKPSEIHFGDIAYLSPSLFGMDNMIKLSGKINGKISNLNAKDLFMNYGGATSFFGNISMAGLPDITETFIHFKINNFTTNRYDLERLKFPAKSSFAIKIPESLYALDKIIIKGNFTGFYNDFVSYGSFYSGLGYVSTDILLKNNPDKNTIEYNGKLKAESFQLGVLSGLTDYLGKMDLDANIIGTGHSLEDLYVEFDGVMDSLEFKGNSYNEITLSGVFKEQKFEGDLKIDDEFVKLDLNGLIDFSGSIPQFDITAGIYDAKLYNLELSMRDSLSLFSTTMEFNFEGDELDSIVGFLALDSTVYIENNQEYFMNNLTLTSDIKKDGSRDIFLYSDFIDLGIQGELSPSIIIQSVKQSLNSNISPISYDTNILFNNTRHNLDFYVDLRNTREISNLFAPFLYIDNNSRISGSYNSDNGEIKLMGTSTGINLPGVKFKDWHLDIEVLKEDITFSTGARNLILKEPTKNKPLSLGVEDFSIDSHIINDSITFGIYWDDGEIDSSNEGEVRGYINIDEFPRIESQITRNDLVINDSIWIINNDHFIIIDTTAITFENLQVEGENQMIQINGKISENPDEILDVVFNNFYISNFSIFLINKGFDLQGIVDGDLKMFDLYDTPDFISDLSIDELYFNNVELGNAMIRTNWDNVQKRWEAFAEVIYSGNEGESKMVELTGNYNTVSNDNNFDFNIALENYKLSTLAPFMDKFMKEFNGYASGNLALKGNRKSPYFEGDISVRRTELRITYLNTLYSISDQIKFRDGYIGFDNVMVYDTLGNSASLNGRINHQFFKDIELDLRLEPRNFASMNTTLVDNELFYGDVFSTGDVIIRGPAQDLSLAVQATTEEGTDVSIPISYTSSITENNFIQFINPVDSVSTDDFNKDQKSGISMNFELDVTDEATIQIFLPMQMGTIKVDGSGLMNMDIGSNLEFDINGTYVINSGVYFFSLQNMLSRIFKIRQGGTISWTGNVYDAKINLKGVSTVRPSLSSLPITTADSSIYNRRVPVDCILGLTGDLLNPNIKFSIEMPDVTEEIRNLVYNSIDTANEVAMNQQMISLLVLNSFSINTGTGGGSSGAGINSYEILSNQLSNLLSNISEDFDIGLNYTRGDALTAEQLEVALSTQLFEDRVLVYGSFGVGGYSDQDKTSNLVGDVLVEVKMTKDGRFRVRAFNKTNSRDLRNDNSPYTQGVGISYRKEFDKFKDIFKRKKKKKKDDHVSLVQ